ncbi:PIN domain-containing protein [Zavarzinia aquatilis]|uniref:Ribonuclease VapC n=1 Tax=Zavarzinia aquatilis TaxID=2211142 RepID=A0A317EF59_9PROT|nr:PIN domain-containing protein [Zavarzinia aquatilis]PWR24770.1 VapC toxin family PIN domain ribonuclease [Zavarzinia aquatilis]
MKPFFDTNIIVYAQQAGPKAERARALLAAGGTISVQILNEFSNVAVRKRGRSWGDVAEAVSDVLAVVAPPMPLTLEMHEGARQLAATHRLSFHDALVVVAAQSAGCDVLYSEDLQNGRVFDGLRVVDPFADLSSGNRR